MESFCKGCLIKYDDQTELVHYTEKNRRLYIYATGLQVKRNDSFPFQLCKDCYIKLKMACDFKKQCRSSDKRYKNYLALKEAGGETDFCSFLKNNDESMIFRLPMMTGNSTPAARKNHEDNESTCTSIRNFMSDILRVDEIPDTEARIIREVIEEEADILDDSLDSQWLQDANSVDTDFRLDMSFSPFSTPHSTNSDRFFTPHKLKEAFNPQIEKIKNDLMSDMIRENDNEVPKNIVIKPTEDDAEASLRNWYVENTTEAIKINGSTKMIENDDCQIDKNIEEALKNDGKEMYPLDRLLVTPPRNIEETLKNDEKKAYPLDQAFVTPPIYRGSSAPSTPTINNILFGEKIDGDNNYLNTPKHENRIETYVDVQGDNDILDEFFIKAETDDNINDNNNDETNDISAAIIKDKEKKEDVQESELEYDLKTFYCKKCEKKFATEKSIRIHFAKAHKKKIPKKKVFHRILRICDYCGKQFNDWGNLIRHIKVHMGVKYICKYCSLEFSAPSNLRKHMTKHLGKDASKPPLKNYVCPICGATFSLSGNLKTHLLRHSTSYTHTCHCGKGYFRSTDLERHARIHSGAKPFTCQYCDRSFARRDVLNRHIKLHIDDRKFKCEHCERMFLTENDLKIHLKNAKVVRKRVRPRTIVQVSRQ